MPVELAPLPYNAVSQELLLDIMQQLGDYSVAIGQMTGDDATSFRIMGSGVCVRRGDEYGVLTAHHVLHAGPRPVAMGNFGPERIYFLAKRGHSPHAAQTELEEIPLGVPTGGYGEFGPDLTVIRLPAGSVRSSLLAAGSFWPLDASADQVLSDFGVDRACLIHTGYPACKNEASRQTQSAHANLTLYGGKSGLLQEDIERRGEWDYVTTTCDYRAFPDLPKSYGGMSGGGIWSVILHRDASGTLALHRFALVGVNFWETGLDLGVQQLRGHFVRSIYGREWRRL